MLIGFEKQKKHFQAAATAGGLAHGYLFSGPDMIGKKMLALWLAELLQKREPSHDADVRFIAPLTEKGKTKGISIEAVRDLKSFISLRPLNGPHKIVIVDEAERLTEDAANAFLKMLEEPPAYSLFIFISSRPQDILPTVRSRLVNMKFLTHSPAAMEKFLGQHLSTADLQTVVLLADGRIGWAVNALNDKKISSVKERVEEFQSILRRGPAERMIYAKKLVASGDYRDAVVLWMRWIRAFGKNPEKTRTALSRLLKLHALLDQPQFNHRLAIENFLINI